MARSNRGVLAALLLVVVAGDLTPARGADGDEIAIRPVTVPIQGAFSYSDDFGDPRSGGRTHAGNDLMTAKLRPLVAAVDGRVRRVKVADGGSEGNMLVLRDDDGWDYWYLHINNDTPGTDDGLNPLEHAFAPGIEVGERVKAGQVVAFAGDSGNAEGTSVHLHFEIHKPDGTAVNPYPSLRIAQGFRYGNYCRFDTNPKPAPDDHSAAGYWLLAADGGVFSFGAAPFHGSTGDRVLNRPAVAMTALRNGSGYWFVADDGGVFAFGDAGFHGSTGGIKLNQPIVGMAATRTGAGYWLVARDGGIFAFGDADWFGSVPGTGLCETAPAVRMAASATGAGYWVVTSDGAVWRFGDAADHGSRTTLGLPPGPAVLDLVTLPPTMSTTTTTTQPPTTTTTRPRSTTTTTRPRSTTTTTRR